MIPRQISWFFSDFYDYSKQIFSKNNWGIYFLILLLGSLLYAKSLYFDFTYLDDNALVLNDIDFIGNSKNILKAFTQDVFGIFRGQAAYYRPLLTISFMPDAALSGKDPFFYHLTNIILHILASILVFKLFVKLRIKRSAAIFLTLIFLVHPALVQAVSWIPGRNDPMLAIFVLASFIFFLRNVEEKKKWSFGLSIFFFLLAMFTKETALVLPVLSVSYLWFRKLPIKMNVLKFGSGWILCFVPWVYLRHLAFKNPISMTYEDAFLSVSKNFPASLQLFGKLVFPFNLNVLPNIEDTTFFWGILALFCLIVPIFYFFYRKKHFERNPFLIWFGIIWFFLFLAPSFLRPDPTQIADFIEHRLYLPIIGILMFIPLFVPKWKNGKTNRWTAVFGFLVVFVFAGLNFFHQDNFSDRMAFWKNASDNSPSSPLAQKNMGAMYYLDKNNKMAEEYYKKALELNDLEPMVHSNLGLIYATRGNYQEAEKEYLKEISFNPNYDNAHFNLGLLYYTVKKPEEAKREWERTLEINPGYVDAREALKILDTAEKQEKKGS